MYLLQSSTNDALAYYFIFLLVFLVVMYLIVKGAVQAGTRKVYKQIFIQNRLLIEQMKKEGLTDERLNEIVSKSIPE